MVQERVVPKSDDDLSGIEIVDTTPPVVEAVTETPPAEVVDAPPAEEVVTVTPEPVTLAQPVTKRTYSDDEWNKRQSAIDKRMADMEAQSAREVAEERRQRQAFEARLAEFDLNAQVEGYRQSEEQRLLATHEPAAARQQANQNAQARKSQYLAQREVEQAKTQTTEAGQLVKLAAADRIRQDFGLQQEDIDHLMSARSLDHMITMAKRLSGTTQAQTQARAEAKARVPIGQRAESPVSPGRGALTPEELTEIYNSGDDRNPRYKDAVDHVAGLMSRRR
jgi:hypothetical protein